MKKPVSLDQFKLKGEIGRKKNENPYTGERRGLDRGGGVKWLAIAHRGEFKRRIVS